MLRRIQENDKEADYGETGYPRSVLSRFIRKVGEDNLIRIIEEKVVKLLRRCARRFLH